MSLKNAILENNTEWIQNRVARGTYVQSVSKIAARHGSATVWDWLFTQYPQTFLTKYLARLALRLAPEEFFPLFMKHFTLQLQRKQLDFTMGWSRLCSVAANNGYVLPWKLFIEWAHAKPLSNRHGRDQVYYYIQHVPDEEIHEFIHATTWTLDASVLNPNLWNTVRNKIVLQASQRPGRLVRLKDVPSLDLSFNTLMSFVMQHDLNDLQLREIQLALNISDDAWAACILVFLQRKRLKTWFEQKIHNAIYTQYRDWWEYRVANPDAPIDEHASFLDRQWYMYHTVIRSKHVSWDLQNTLQYLQELVTFIASEKIEEIDI